MSEKIYLDKDDVGSEYIPTDSENDYSEEEKELMRNVRNSNKREVDAKQQVLAFQDSDDEDDNELHDSDIEGADVGNVDEGLPDEMDWGDKSRNYYHTDFVDPDYDEYNEKEMEMAQQEEEEAKNIQQRLLKQMKEADFMLDAEILKAGEAKSDLLLEEEAIKIKTDISGLSKREQERLFVDDSPEFVGLTANFAEYLTEQRDLVMPVLNYIKENNMPVIPAIKFAQLHQNIVLSYCSNVAFYLLLKSKRVTIRSHPITKRLLSLKLLLKEMSDRYENIIKPQLEALLERIQDGDVFEILEIQTTKTDKKQQKSKLRILDEYEMPALKAETVNKEQQMVHEGNEVEDNEDGDMEDDEIADDEEGNARRGITYQIAKNKGIMPHRKKELRNPRVKHRTKFRKALIRRKGAVRTVRKETKRYAGEMSGIKATVSKSIKFKV